MRDAFHFEPPRDTLPFRKTVFRENFGEFFNSPLSIHRSGFSINVNHVNFFFFFHSLLHRGVRLYPEARGSVKVVGEIRSNAICSARLAQSVTGNDRWRAASRYIPERFPFMQFLELVIVPGANCKPIIFALFNDSRFQHPQSWTQLFICYTQMASLKVIWHYCSRLCFNISQI